MDLLSRYWLSLQFGTLWKNKKPVLVTDSMQVFIDDFYLNESMNKAIYIK